MNEIVLTVAAVSALALTDCSATEAGTGLRSAHHTTPTAVEKPSPEPVPTAAQVVKKIVANIPRARAGKVFTAANDPNHEMGRPGEYTSKAQCNDSRYPHPVLGEDICSVEVFMTQAQAKARVKYLHAGEKQYATLLQGESGYDYIDGSVLLRLSFSLTPARAAQYKRAAF